MNNIATNNQTLGAPLAGGLGAPLAGGLALGTPAGGLGTPSTAVPFGTAGVNTLSGTMGAGGYQYAIIGYIAPTDAVVKPTVDTTKARKIFKENYDKATPEVKSQQKPQLNAKGEEVKTKDTQQVKMIALKDTFSMAQFRTFFYDDYKALVNEKDLQVDMSICRVEFFVIKNLTSEAQNPSAYEASNSFLIDNTTAVDTNNGVACLKKLQLFALMVAISESQFKVVVDGETVGFLLIAPSKAQSTDASKPQRVNIVFADKHYQKVPNLRSLVNSKGKRVPYAVHKRMTKPTQTPIVKEKVINATKFNELFPEIDVTKLQERLTIVKANYASDQDFHDAKAAQVNSYADIKADLDALQISEDVYKALNEKTKGKSVGQASSFKAQAQNALTILKQQLTK